MFRSVTCAALLVLIAASTVRGQETGTPKQLLLPGSVNATFGSVGAVEPDNVLGSVAVEQGFTPWQRGSISLVGFVDVALRADTQGYAWNNTTPYVTGVKLVATGSFGVLQAAVGIAGDLRSSEKERLSRATYLTYWKGWQPPTANRQFPGHMWASSGIVTAREPHNWISSAHVEQGVTVWRHRGVAVVPFTGVTATTDTENRPWNNRGSIDVGVKVATSIKGAVVDAGVAHRVDRAWHTGRSQTAPVLFVNLWMGWTPRVIR